MHPSTHVGCQKATSPYLCERYGILCLNFNATCLSMLYDQNINVVLELCPLTIIPQKEVINQIPANTWSSLPNLSPVIWKA